MTDRPRAYSYIRMSTDVQLKGDSRRRQLEKSAEYADQHGLDLVSEDQLQDLGVSAFKGANIAQGALGQFLEAAKAGTVPRGSFLLVESLDRLSRQPIQQSFLSILNAGVNIVTLTDNRIYTEGKVDLTELITSLVTMSRAHEESLIKSVRVGAAWANKRAKASSQPLTKMCPAWLRLSNDGTQYEAIEERAATIKRIFADSAAGIGNYSITQRLNKQKVPHFGKSYGWHLSYVAKILKNRAVIGEFQPHKFVNGRRQPDGPTVLNYFPAVVDDDTFYRVQLGLSQRLNHGAGRKGASFTNIFSGIAKCAYCGSPMKFENKGKPPKGATFLVCDGAKRGLGCKSAGWRYDEFEASFLTFVQEIELSELVGTDDDDKRAALDGAIAALRGELRDIDSQRERAFELLQKVDTASNYVAGKLDELESRRHALEKVLDERTTELASVQARANSVQDREQDLKKLTTALDAATGDELYKLRAQIAQQIRSVCSCIYIAPLGPTAELQVAPISETDSKAVAKIKGETNAEAAGRRFFAVKFSKSMRAVFPSDDDPKRLDIMRYIGAESGTCNYTGECAATLP